MMALMQKPSAIPVIVSILIGVLVIIVIMAFAGLIGSAAGKSEQVSMTGCVVTEVSEEYWSKSALTNYFLETENCGKLRATKELSEKVEAGNTYDLSGESLNGNTIMTGLL